MLKKNFIEVYNKFRLQFYRQIFVQVSERDGSLSAMEAFSLQVIDLLGNPSISEFADFLNISQSNATYKVNSLIKKGYLERIVSENDHREYHLVLTDKYYQYERLFGDYESKVIARIERRLSKEDAEKFDEILGVISRELMQECNEPASNISKNPRRNSKSRGEDV